MLGQERRLNSDNISVVTDKGVPSIIGECPMCQRGTRSLIIADFVPNRLSPIESTVYIKCIACLSLYQTKTKDIAKE